LIVVSPTYERIYTVVQSIPPGRVATYGQVATAAKLPGQARLVGYALHALPEDSEVPWHRVVNFRGRSSLDTGLGADRAQLALLAAEGVASNTDGSIDLERYGLKYPKPPPESREQEPETGSIQPVIGTMRGGSP
jgi:methylated-DNA-protein-cysteine methyltransferase-like protein